MTVASLSQDLYRFAIELRQLAYTMPGGREDPLIRLSERMAHHAKQQTAEGLVDSRTTSAAERQDVEDSAAAPTGGAWRSDQRCGSSQSQYRAPV